MTDFTDFAAIRIRSAGLYSLADHLDFEIGRKGSKFFYRVPAGFTFDVSIPAFACWVFNQNDFRYLRAAALHDHMLVSGWDRQTAAAVFYRALRASFVQPWRAITMYLAVSIHSLFFADQTVKGA